MTSRTRWVLELYQIGAGLSDSLTGLLLLLAPGWTLRLLGITYGPDPIFAGYIGALVLGVGLSYLWLEMRWLQGKRSAAEWDSQWRCTALIRLCVATFLFVQMATGRLETAWSTVAAFDAFLAIFQFLGIRLGWLHSASSLDA